MKLNRNTAAWPVLRYLKSFFLNDRVRILKIPFGLYKAIRFELDLASQTQLYLGLWERETHECIRKLCAEIKTAIDVGAGRGEHTLYFACKTPAKKVYAIEPNHEMCEYIRRHVSLNNLEGNSRIRLIRNAAGECNAQDQIKLDSIYHDVECPCFIKIDVDGGEMHVLRGALQLLSLPDVRWLIETHSPDLEADCIEFLSRYGYRTTIIENAWWRFFIPEQRPIALNRWISAHK